MDVISYVHILQQFKPLPTENFKFQRETSSFVQYLQKTVQS